MLLSVLVFITVMLGVFLFLLDVPEDIKDRFSLISLSIVVILSIICLIMLIF